jgi:hypothetical protein
MSHRKSRHRTLLRVLTRTSAALAVVIGLGALAGNGVAASAAKPANTAPPTISGTPQEGKTLTGDRGVWTNSPTDYNYFWARCDKTGDSCATISGAHALTYTLTSADVGNTLRFRVQASNGDGSTTATSVPSAVVTAAPPPSTTTVTTTTVATTTVTTPAPPPAVNHRPTIALLSVRFVGARVYARFRACDDSRRNLTIVERDSKPGVPSYTRRFSTLSPPRPCTVLSRTWIPAPRFRHGRYTVTLWARDKSGLTSRLVRRTFVR